MKNLIPGIFSLMVMVILNIPFVYSDPPSPYDPLQYAPPSSPAVNPAPPSLPQPELPSIMEVGVNANSSDAASSDFSFDDFALIPESDSGDPSLGPAAGLSFSQSLDERNLTADPPADFSVPDQNFNLGPFSAEMFGQLLLAKSASSVDGMMKTCKDNQDCMADSLLQSQKKNVEKPAGTYTLSDGEMITVSVREGSLLVEEKPLVYSELWKKSVTSQKDADYFSQFASYPSGGMIDAMQGKVELILPGQKAPQPAAPRMLFPEKTTISTYQSSAEISLIAQGSVAAQLTIEPNSRVYFESIASPNSEDTIIVLNVMEGNITMKAVSSQGDSQAAIQNTTGLDRPFTSAARNTILRITPQTKA